jgi:hypothetical protein
VREAMPQAVSSCPPSACDASAHDLCPNILLERAPEGAAH